MAPSDEVRRTYFGQYSAAWADCCFLISLYRSADFSSEFTKFLLTTRCGGNLPALRSSFDRLAPFAARPV
jgi:hypothetical protein